MNQWSFSIKGMRCAGCAANLQKKISGLNGIQSCSVNIATNTMNITCSNDISPESIISAVAKAGFHGDLIQDPSKEYTAAEEESSGYFRRFLTAAIFSILLNLFSMHKMIGVSFESMPDQINISIQILLLLPILFAGNGFYKRGFSALFRLSPNMDTLIAVSTSSAIVYSILLLCSGNEGHLYFDTAGMIIFLIMLGKYLEAKSKGKASGAIRNLMQLTPDTAEVIQPDGTIKTVKSEQIIPGDMIRVLPGTRIPVDGVITEGSGSVDESMLTGESVPVEKSTGCRVTGGSISLNGKFQFRADRTGKETVLSRIISLVKNAQSTKPEIAKIADIVSRYFVWSVLGIALLTFFIWYCAADKNFETALGFSLAVLVISCPCALGLATPAAVIAGTGRGAGLGILFRNGNALETAGKITAAVFDKTGTLTYGVPCLQEIRTFSDSGISRDELLQIAGSAADLSVHPLSKAISKERKQKGFSLLHAENFEEIPGMGIKAEIQRKTILSGNQTLMLNNGIHFPSAEIPEGVQFVYTAVNGKPAGIFIFADQIRTEAENVVRSLERMKIKSVILSGDNQTSVCRTAEKTGIKQYFSGLLPEKKWEKIRELRQNGEITAMIGDGINDAPSLAAADIGISLSSGTDIAMESAQIVLMRQDLNGILQAIRLSRATMRIIRQNLFWAFCYNAVCIPLAAGCFYPAFHWQIHPAAGAAAMALSSVTVVCNALRLFRWK